MVEAEKTKGSQKVGGEVAYTIGKFHTESRFQAIFKISEDLATRSPHIPMATPAGAERPLPPSDWTCALRFSMDPATHCCPHLTPTRLVHITKPCGHLVGQPESKTFDEQKAVRGQGDRGILSHQPAARTVRLRSRLSSSYSTQDSVRGSLIHITPFPVLGLR